MLYATYFPDSFYALDAAAILGILAIFNSLIEAKKGASEIIKPKKEVQAPTTPITDIGKKTKGKILSRLRLYSIKGSVKILLILILSCWLWFHIKNNKTEEAVAAPPAQENKSIASSTVAAALPPKVKRENLLVYARINGILDQGLSKKIARSICARLNAKTPVSGRFIDKSCLEDLLNGNSSSFLKYKRAAAVKYLVIADGSERYNLESSGATLSLKGSLKISYFDLAAGTNRDLPDFEDHDNWNFDSVTVKNEFEDKFISYLMTCNFN